MECFRQQQEHDEAAIAVDRGDAGRGGTQGADPSAGIRRFPADLKIQLVPLVILRKVFIGVGIAPFADVEWRRDA
jgi:hypothetical protein